MKRFLSWLLAVMIAAAAVITTSVPGAVCAAESFGAGAAETAAEAGTESAETGMSGGIQELSEGEPSAGSSTSTAKDVLPQTGETDENNTGVTAAEAAEKEEPGTGTTQVIAAEVEPGAGTTQATAAEEEPVEAAVQQKKDISEKKARDAVLTAVPEPDWIKGGGGIRNVTGIIKVSHRGGYRYWYKKYGLLGGDEEDWSTFCYGIYVGDKRVGWSYCLDPHLDGREMEGVYAGEVYEVSAPMFAKALYYGPSGPGSDVIEGVTGTSDYGFNNIVTHVAASEIYARLGYSQSDSGEGFIDANSKLRDLVYRYVNAIEDLPVPSDYYGYVTEQNGRSSYGYRNQNFGFGSFSLMPGAKVKKVSADPDITNGNSCYGYKDARYWIYTSKEAAIARGSDGFVKGGTLITGADGTSGTVELSPGTYYMIEGIAPKGYKRSDEVYKFTAAAGETTLVTVHDTPKYMPADLLIEKKCKDGEDGNSLEGTKFTVNYYDGYYDAASLPSKPSASWVIKVLKDGDRYTAALQDDNLVSGTLYKKGDEVVLPLGTVTIEETEAAPGYINDGTFDGFKMYIGQIKVISGSGEVVLADIQGKRNSSNSFVVQNTPVPPGIITEALDQATGSKNAFAEGEISISDTVSYSSLVIGRQYVLKGRLVEKDTGEAVRDAEGNEVTAEKSFTADAFDGSVDIVFTFRADSSLAGKTAVVFETLQHEGKDLAVHADLEDVPQQIYFPGIRTEAVNPVTGDHIMYAGEEAEIRDTISYENLLPGTEYTLRGALVVRSTGEPLTIDGGEVTAEKTFIPESPDGEEELIFTFDASGLSGSKLVVFEELYLDKSLIAQHKDPEDDKQTVYIPDGHTMAVDPDTEEHTMKAGGTVIIRDRIFYENLVPGAEYAVRGRVMQKPAGKEEVRELEAVMTDEKGSEVEELIFTPKERDGSVDVYFALNSDELKGKSAVIFETVEYINTEEGSRVLLFTHEDIEDEEQTIHFPDGGTTALDSETGGHSANADENVRILDEVRYINLIPGKTYTVTGTLMDKKTGSPVTAGGRPVTVSKEFVPERADGSVIVEFEFDASQLAGRSVTAFEKVSSCGKDVFVHEDLKDQDQSIYFRRTGTSAAATGDENHAVLWTAVLVTASACAAGIIFRRRKKN